MSIADSTSAGSAAVYSYSGANPTAITAEGSVSMAANTLSYSYPAYSATVLVIKGAPPLQQPVPNGTY